MKIYIGSDHAAFDEKAAVIKHLSDHTVEDLGTFSKESCHYPEFAKAVSNAVQSNQNSLGILLCGSGIGVSMVANRFKGIRAARCLSVEDAKMSKLHNNSNIICLAARMSSMEDIKLMIQTWLDTEFEGGRHLKRVDLFDELGC